MVWLPRANTINCEFFPVAKEAVVKNPKYTTSQRG
jgi:hypothetical protein